MILRQSDQLEIDEGLLYLALDDEQMRVSISTASHVFVIRETSPRRILARAQGYL